MIVRCQKCGYEIETGHEGQSSPGSDIACPACGHLTDTRAADVKQDAAAQEPRETDPGRVNDDGGNWEEFVNISKTEEEPEDFNIGDSPELGKQDSNFNWENLSIDREPEYPADRTPAMFEEEDHDLRPEHRHGKPEISAEDNVTSAGRPDDLSVDMDILARNPHARQTVGAGSGAAADDNFRTYDSGPGRGGGILSKLVYTILTIAVLSVILVASFIILLHLGVIPKESESKITELVESVVPLKLGEIGEKNIIIKDHNGRWLGTRNGYLYVVSGMVENKSKVPVNYIKVSSEFMAGGQVLYQSEVYAGNTFADNELKVSPLQDILLKLQKKNGNIDYYNTENLAGLNYDIRPGESIPFYAVFPSTSRVLGLRYRLKVAGFED
jgi:DNA-directed RNA polymerase subunit RPC12/RpoP